MVSLLVWDQGAQVRFLHRRPVFWAVSANGNTSGLQPEIESSILSISTIIWKFSSAVEQRPYKAKVKGSIPLTSTKAPVTELAYVSVLEAEF